jgi:hypothetical protein
MTDILDKSTVLEADDISTIYHAADKSTIYDAVEVGYDVTARLDVVFGFIGDDGFFIEGHDGEIVVED